MSHLLCLIYCTLKILFLFYTLKFVATLHLASLVVPFVQKHLLTSCLCYILVILAIFQAFPSLFYLLWWSVISDLILLQKYYNLLKAQKIKSKWAHHLHLGKIDIFCYFALMERIKLKNHEVKVISQAKF